MAIEFRCTQCHRLLRIGDDAAGRQARCPDCGAISLVPPAGTEAPVPDAASELPTLPPRSQPGSPFAPGGPMPAGGGQPLNPYEAPATYGPAQKQPFAVPPLREVPNYLVQAILCTLFCCLPFGIVAIVFAAQVNGKLAAGDYQGAVSASGSARTWCWVSFWLGLIPIILWILVMSVWGFGAAMR
jgi:DNA-directed RNA polymerase subunit RPC12/RpoP